MKIYIANESTVLTDEEVSSWMPAIHIFSLHVRAVWPRNVEFALVPASKIPHDAWQILLLDDSDQEGALGYHDYTPGGKPISKIFAKTDIDNGYNVTVTLTHEIAEMMTDPYISELFQVSNTQFMAKEVCDAVENDSYGYKINDIVVSDFQYPAWFIPGHPGPQYDKAKHCTRPLQLLSGGYMSIFESGKGWKQVYGEKMEEVAIDEKGALSRPAKYARDRGENA